MTAEEINKLSFEHRMSYIGSQPPTAPAKEVWRTKLDFKVQVSNMGNRRPYTREQLLYTKVPEVPPLDKELRKAIMETEMWEDLFPLQLMRREG